MQTYTQTVAAGSVFSLNIAGKYFRVLEAPNGPVDIIFYRHGGVSGNAEQVGPGYWSKPKDYFSRVDIYSATAQKIKIAVADGEGGYDVVGVTGVVGMVDGSKKITLAGNAFFSGSSFGSTVNNPAIQLWNPVGSGMNLIVKKIRYSNRSAGLNPVYFSFNSTPLTTQIGVASKLIGASAGIGQVRYQDVVVAAIGVFNYSMTQYAVEEWRAEEPFCIQPGKGMIVAGTAGNFFISAHYEWFEEPI